MATNQVVRVQEDVYVPKYSTHWHLRFTDPTPEAFGILEEMFARFVSEGYFTYVLLSESSDEGQRKHYHCAVGTSKSIKKTTLQRKLNLLKKDDVKRVCFCFYLCSVYNDSTPLSNYEYVKNGHTVLLELGSFGVATTNVARTESTKEKWRAIIALAKAQKWDELETTFPSDWVRQGAKLKAQYWQQTKSIKICHERHLWIWGLPGTGKSNIVEVLFPDYYSKRPDDDWTGFQGHGNVYLGDLDPLSFQRAGIHNMKIWSDPQGFNGNRKYGGGEHIGGARMIVTSNFTIEECMKHDWQGFVQLLAAMKRRFREVHIDQLLAEHDLQLRTPFELQVLQSQGNEDYALCFTSRSNPDDITEYALEDIDSVINKLPLGF